MAKSKKRHVFGELMEGVGAMRAHREGRITLRSHHVPPLSLPAVDERLIRTTRERLRMSRTAFAHRLGVNHAREARWFVELKRSGWALDMVSAVAWYGLLGLFRPPPRCGNRLSAGDGHSILSLKSLAIVHVIMVGTLSFYWVWLFWHMPAKHHVTRVGCNVLKACRGFCLDSGSTT